MSVVSCDIWIFIGAPVDSIRLAISTVSLRRGGGKVHYRADTDPKTL
jgi:hypothetical protein